MKGKKTISRVDRNIRNNLVKFADNLPYYSAYRTHPCKGRTRVFRMRNLKNFPLKSVYKVFRVWDAHRFRGLKRVKKKRVLYISKYGTFFYKMQLFLKITKRWIVVKLVDILNSNLCWKLVYRTSTNLNQTPSIIID